MKHKFQSKYRFGCLQNKIMVVYIVSTPLYPFTSVTSGNPCRRDYYNYNTASCQIAVHKVDLRQLHSHKYSTGKEGSNDCKEGEGKQHGAIKP